MICMITFIIIGDFFSAFVDIKAGWNDIYNNVQLHLFIFINIMYCFFVDINFLSLLTFNTKNANLSVRK